LTEATEGYWGIHMGGLGLGCWWSFTLTSPNISHSAGAPIWPPCRKAVINIKNNATTISGGPSLPADTLQTRTPKILGLLGHTGFLRGREPNSTHQNQTSGGAESHGNKCVWVW
jgi:hypothetical protein